MTARKLGVPMERVVVTVAGPRQHLGRLDSARALGRPRRGRIRRGDVLLIEAIGGGLAWGAAVVRW